MSVQRLTKEDYVEIYRRVLPSDYVAPLEVEDGGLGMDLAYAFAAMMELADCATNKGTQSYFLRPHSSQTDVPAQEQAKATGTVTLTRQGNFLSRATVPANSVIEAFATDSYGDPILIGRYLVREGVTVLEGSAESVTIQISAEFPGYFGNLALGAASLRFEELGRQAIPCHVDATHAYMLIPAAAVESDDVWDRKTIGRHIILEATDSAVFDTVLQYPRRITGIFAGVFDDYATIDPSVSGADLGKPCIAHVIELNDLLSITQVTPIAGGNGGMLDARVADLGLGRAANESDTTLATRVESIADTTTSAAVARAIDAVLGPFGVAWRLMETGDPRGLGGRVWDLHPWDFGSLGTVGSGAEVYDVQGAIWLSVSQMRRFFVVAVSPAIEHFPGVASQVWTRVNAARGFGVSFRMVIDESL